MSESGATAGNVQQQIESLEKQKDDLVTRIADSSEIIGNATTELDEATRALEQAQEDANETPDDLAVKVQLMAADARVKAAEDRLKEYTTRKETDENLLDPIEGVLFDLKNPAIEKMDLAQLDAIEKNLNAEQKDMEGIVAANAVRPNGSPALQSYQGAINRMVAINSQLNEVKATRQNINANGPQPDSAAKQTPPTPPVVKVATPPVVKVATPPPTQAVNNPVVTPPPTTPTPTAVSPPIAAAGKVVPDTKQTDYQKLVASQDAANQQRWAQKYGNDPNQRVVDRDQNMDKLKADAKESFKFPKEMSSKDPGEAAMASLMFLIQLLAGNGLRALGAAVQSIHSHRMEGKERVDMGKIGNQTARMDDLLQDRAQVDVQKGDLQKKLGALKPDDAKGRFELERQIQVRDDKGAFLDGKIAEQKTHIGNLLEGERNKLSAQGVPAVVLSDAQTPLPPAAQATGPETTPPPVAQATTPETTTPPVAQATTPETTTPPAVDATAPQAITPAAASAKAPEPITKLAPASQKLADQAAAKKEQRLERWEQKRGPKTGDERVVTRAENRDKLAKSFQDSLKMPEEMKDKDPGVAAMASLMFLLSFLLGNLQRGITTGIKQIHESRMEGKERQEFGKVGPQMKVLADLEERRGKVDTLQGALTKERDTKPVGSKAYVELDAKVTKQQQKKDFYDARIEQQSQHVAALGGERQQEVLAAATPETRPLLEAAGRAGTEQAAAHQDPQLPEPNTEIDAGELEQETEADLAASQQADATPTAPEIQLASKQQMKAGTKDKIGEAITGQPIQAVVSPTVTPVTKTPTPKQPTTKSPRAEQVQVQPARQEQRGEQAVARALDVGEKTIMGLKASATKILSKFMAPKAKAENALTPPTTGPTATASVVNPVAKAATPPTTQTTPIAQQPVAQTNATATSTNVGKPKGPEAIVRDHIKALMAADNQCSNLFTVIKSSFLQGDKNQPNGKAPNNIELLGSMWTLLSTQLQLMQPIVSFLVAPLLNNASDNAPKSTAANKGGAPIINARQDSNLSVRQLSQGGGTGKGPGMPAQTVSSTPAAKTGATQGARKSSGRK